EQRHAAAARIQATHRGRVMHRRFQEEMARLVPREHAEDGCIYWHVTLVKSHPRERYGFSHTTDASEFSRARGALATPGVPAFLMVKTVAHGGLLSSWNEDHPEAEVISADRIVEVNGIAGDPIEMQAQLMTGSVRMRVCRYPARFSVRLARGEGQRFGVKFRGEAEETGSNAACLQIQDLHPKGLLEMHNLAQISRGQFHCVVTKGMSIEAVNDVRGNAETLIECLRTCTDAQLIIQRGEAMEQCFLERFRLEPRLFGGVLRVEPESYSYRSERSSSSSTPGIMTTYMTHEVTVRVADPTDPELAKIGLPEMEPFTTGPIVHAGIPESNWAWHTVGLTQADLWHDGLTHLLTRHGIKADDYHSDALNDLWEEVHRGKYATLSVREDFELERRINIVKVWLCAEIFSVDHVLVRKFEVERGEKNFEVQDRPLTGRMTVDQSWESCVVETVETKMGLEGAFQNMAFSVDERSYRLSEEIGYSSKFPGLRTLYCIHEVRCRIHDPDSDGMEGLGLPDGHDFTLVRIKHQKKDNSGSVRTMTRWCWKPMAELMYSSQSFQHGLVDQPSCVNEKQEQKRRLPAPSPPRLPEEASADGESPASKTGCWVLAEVMRGKRPNSDRALNAAKKIRDANYTCRHFFDDCMKAFPELALYMVGAEDGTEALTSSGRTPDDEYQRTMGALFAVYWLMRRTIDGAQSFCFGVDNDWNPLSEKSPFPSRSPEELEKRRTFLEQMKWEELEQLFMDAGLLRKDPEGPGGWSHDVERTLAMLVLTAIHDIMKVKALLPVDQEGEKISDHDAALAFVLEHYPSVLPSFEMLPRASKQSVKFTQCKMEYNMGWLVQAEAPPGALFQKFKDMIMSGQVSGCDVAFYFVHWLTDLAGAEPCPQEGCEKFVLKFPQKVSQHSTTLAETCSDGGRSVWSEVDSVDGAGRATGDCETEAADGLEQVAPAEVCPSGMALDDQPRRLLAVDLGFEEVDVLGDEPGESPVSTPRCPAAAAFEDILQEKRSPAPDAASEGNDREGDENARAARARADLMLAYRPAQAVSSGGHRGARRADKGADGSGRKVQLTPLEAKPQDAKRRVKKLAAELGCGDAENAARIAGALARHDPLP
ncbi:unnamed protein product, partial [Prorocentrum cordatum]